MKNIIKKLMSWSQETRIGLMVGVIAIIFFSSVGLTKNWWGTKVTSSSSSSSSQTTTTSSSSTINITSGSPTSSNKPVLNPIDEKIGLPFDVEATLVRGYYDVSDTVEKQAESIVFYDGKYYPNRGVDYVYNNEEFDVLAVASGEVSNIINDPIYGLVIKVECASNVETIYSSLSMSDVNIGDKITIGQVIGKAGESIYGSELAANHLHLEIYKDGNCVNPLKNYYVSLANVK